MAKRSLAATVAKLAARAIHYRTPLAILGAAVDCGMPVRADHRRQANAEFASGLFPQHTKTPDASAVATRGAADDPTAGVEQPAPAAGVDARSAAVDLPAAEPAAEPDWASVFSRTSHDPCIWCGGRGLHECKPPSAERLWAVGPYHAPEHFGPLTPDEIARVRMLLAYNFRQH